MKTDELAMLYLYQAVNPWTILCLNPSSLQSDSVLISLEPV